MRAGAPARRVAAVDMGTNSTRLLVAEATGTGWADIERIENVTGLGAGVDRSGRLSPEAIERTLRVLSHYGEIIRRSGVGAARAVATSASRDAGNGDDFIEAAQQALGFRPEIIGGEEEAAFVFAGATRPVENPGRTLVVDIGGGSTEIVTDRGGVSIDIGSIRLTERRLPNHPATSADLAGARREVSRAMRGADPPHRPVGMGTAGTWTSLAALDLGLPSYNPLRVEGAILRLDRMVRMVARLASLTLEEKRALPGLHPKRAPVILGGAIVAETTMRILGLEEITVTGHDILDGVCLSLAGQVGNGSATAGAS